MALTQNGKSVLLGEDEHTVGAFVRAMLQNAGYSVTVAVDGQDGPATAREFKGAARLLLSDGEMHRITGTEFATQTQIERRGVHALLMSGMHRMGALGRRRCRQFSTDGACKRWFWRERRVLLQKESSRRAK